MEAAVPKHQPRDLPPATDEGLGADGSLVGSYAERTPRAAEELAVWVLPFQAKTAIVELLIAVAMDEPARLAVLISDNARWGLPDRREFRARKISSDADPLGLDFMQAFRVATSRFAKKASFSCTPLQPGWQTFAAAGAEPVWCSYTSSDSLDIVGFRLIMERDELKIDYVGFFPVRMTGAIRVPTEFVGDPPPLTPYVRRPVDLEAPTLMTDGSNPILEKRAPRPAPKPEKVVTPPSGDEVEPADKPSNPTVELVDDAG